MQAPEVHRLHARGTITTRSGHGISRSWSLAGGGYMLHFTRRSGLFHLRNVSAILLAPSRPPPSTVSPSDTRLLDEISGMLQNSAMRIRSKHHRKVIADGGHNLALSIYPTNMD